MPRQRTNPSKLPKTVWTCPHCGTKHGPAELMRMDFDNLKCQGCGKTFEAKTNMGEE